ncbi:MAG: carboxymuconolactone decarboxylase family protein [Halothece sp.]
MTFLPSSPNASLMEIFQNYPDLSKSIHEFAQELMRGDSPFTPAQRELIAAFVSSQNGCEYCRDSHTATATQLGQPEGLVQELVQDIETANIDRNLKPVLRYVKKLTLTPNEVKQTDIDAILSMGWDETAVVHANLVCAFFNLMNRWVEGLGIESNPKAVSQASHHLSRYGYQGIVDVVSKT